MKVRLILEKGSGSLWGGVSYGKEMIVDSAASIQALKKSLEEF